MTFKWLTLSLVFLLWGAAPGLAQDAVSQMPPSGGAVTASKKPVIAYQCMSCHGPAGLSQNPNWPNIAGQQKAYLASQLRNFRSGARQNDMMQTIVTELSEEDIDQVAQYFSSLPVVAK